MLGKETLTTHIAILGTRFGAPTIEESELSAFSPELIVDSAATAEELLAAAKDSVAVLAGAPPKFTRDVLAQLPNLKTIVRYGVGIESIDLEAATEHGIIVANVPDYATEEVSLHAVSLILAGVRKLLTAHNAIKNGIWQVATVRPLFSTENQTAGIIGFGKIGQAVARKLRPFGFELLVFDPYATESALAEHGAKSVALAELLEKSDVISLNAPLTDSTRHIINADALKQMKSTAFIVNTGRGGLIDEYALAEALENGEIAGAGLDVLETEPIQSDHPLLKSDKVILTPHMAWYTNQAAERMRRLACQEVVRVLNGEKPLNLVNPDVLGKIKTN